MLENFDLFFKGGGIGDCFLLGELLLLVFDEPSTLTILLPGLGKISLMLAPLEGGLRATFGT